MADIIQYKSGRDQEQDEFQRDSMRAMLAIILATTTQDNTVEEVGEEVREKGTQGKRLWSRVRCQVQMDDSKHLKAESYVHHHEDMLYSAFQEQLFKTWQKSLISIKFIKNKKKRQSPQLQLSIKKLYIQLRIIYDSRQVRWALINQWLRI